jgi:hypothetical protein
MLVSPAAYNCAQTLQSRDQAKWQWRLTNATANIEFTRNSKQNSTSPVDSDVRLALEPNASKNIVLSIIWVRELSHVQSKVTKCVRYLSSLQTAVHGEMGRIGRET